MLAGLRYGLPLVKLVQRFDSKNPLQVGGRRLRPTARVHVCEESHCSIVPMNHSNKDGVSSAESEEGRLRLKENALSSDTYPTQSGNARVPQVGECAGKCRFWVRYLSARTTGCAKERSSGSVRGGITRVLSLPGSST